MWSDAPNITRPSYIEVILFCRSPATTGKINKNPLVREKNVVSTLYFQRKLSFSQLFINWLQLEEGARWIKYYFYLSYLSCSWPQAVLKEKRILQIIYFQEPTDIDVVYTLNSRTGSIFSPAVNKDLSASHLIYLSPAFRLCWCTYLTLCRVRFSFKTQ